MRKKLFSIIIILVLLSFSSCFKDMSVSGLKKYDSNKIADTTFNEIINAIETDDANRIVELFSETAQKENNISYDALKLIEFVEGEVTSYNAAVERGVAVYSEANYGKRKRTIEPTFCLHTTEKSYYIAIRECIIDEFDESNVGVLSLYIIDADNWQRRASFRGDGKWSLGINILTEIVTEPPKTDHISPDLSPPDEYFM